MTSCLPPEWGAEAVLHPARRPVTAVPEQPHEDVVIAGEGPVLRGWLFRGHPPRRGLVVNLHGIGDNRQSGLGLARRFVPEGYDVLLYDSRAHGESGGTDCTYGFYEKADVSRALDALGARGAILFGSSLGASVALQAAAADRRILGVIAQSPFSDLRTVIEERAPWFATRREVAEAIALAEARGGFRVDDVSPERAAGSIRVGVLLIHGERDSQTRPAHSHRIFEALAGEKRLLIVPGAGHDDVLAGAAPWAAIDAWLRARPLAGDP